MRRFHIAIGVQDIEASVQEYSQRLAAKPELIIPDEYALWRTDSLNFSIRKVEGEIGKIRHLGWEDETASEFSKECDINGIIWEHFAAQHQDQEIQQIWPFNA